MDVIFSSLEHGQGLFRQSFCISSIPGGHANKTNSPGANLDMRSMPVRASPWMDLVNGAYPATSITGSPKFIWGQGARRKFFYILSSVNGPSLYHYCLLFFKDKFVWNEFEQPKAGPKGKLQDVACKSRSPLGEIKCLKIFEKQDFSLRSK